MQYRLPFVLALAALGAAGGFAVACSSDNTVDAGAPDTSTGDTSTIPDGGGPIDMNVKDTSPPQVCMNGPLMGSCDIVSQNCPSGQECVEQSADGGAVISCQKASTGAITEGDTCTASSNNPCVAGLVCVNNRCSKPCCPDSPGAASGDSTICGTSKEGYPGVCDLEISDPKTNKALYMVCEYNPPCEPFGIQPCATGSECQVRDPAGTATCEAIYNYPPGLAAGATCMYANACQDGMLCTSKCQIVCYHASSSSPPFDAGALQLTTPLKGGCPGNTACPAGTVMNMPSWLGLCP